MLTYGNKFATDVAASHGATIAFVSNSGHFNLY
jgi:hypothetical protein